METKEETLDILNDLVLVNNDRIAWYDRVLKELSENDTDLKPVFTEIISDSHSFKMELGTEVQALGEEMETGTTAGGKIYRSWMNFKELFTGNDRKSILESCEASEDAVLKAYTEALNDDELPAFLGEIISNQQIKVENAHDKVKALRDAA